MRDEMMEHACRLNYLSDIVSLKLKSVGEDAMRASTESENTIIEDTFMIIHRSLKESSGTMCMAIHDSIAADAQYINDVFQDAIDAIEAYGKLKVL